MLYRFSLQSVSILVPRGRAPFGQHQKPKGARPAGDENGQRGQDVARCHVKRHLADLALEKRFKSISHISVERFAIASAGFYVLLASFAAQRKELSLTGLS